VAEISRLLDTYVESVIAHADEEDTDRATKGFFTAQECYCKLCEHGQAGVNALRALLTHDRIEVRQSVACHLLPFDPISGLRVLKRCAKDPSVQVGLSSEMAVQQWVVGKLTFPMIIEGKLMWGPPELVAQNSGNTRGKNRVFTDDRQLHDGIIGKAFQVIRRTIRRGRRWFQVFVA